MDFRADGKLLVASWDRDGAVFLIDPTARAGQSVQRIAEGLHEPLGLVVVGQRLFVLQKQELTELVDRDGDDVIDEYRAFTYGWPTSSNFHSFAFGLVHRGDYLYALLSICVMPGGASCPEQLPTQGKLLRIALADGSVEIIASGFRTPNGIGLGVRDEIFVTDNQGDWLPASKLVHIQEGHFYGSRAVPDEELMQAEETLPVVWLPQDEIGNSPSQPLLMNEGPYTGQMIYGDVTNGGIKRVYMERVGGAWQGAAFHFSAGLQGAVNRLLRGPDGSIYVGEIGNPPNWGETGKAWHGLERLSYRGGPAFEVLQINAEPDGFSLTLTEPLHESIQLEAGDLIAKQWFYHPTEQYGGAKYDHSELPVTTLELSPDRRRIKAEIPDLKAGYVVYLHLDPRLVSNKGQSLWVGEAWYTLNAIPRADSQVERTEISSADDDSAEGWKILLAGKTLGGWRNYGDPEGSVENWKIEDGVLALQPSRFSRLSMIAAYLFGGGTGDLIYAEERFRNFELSLEWRIAENGNSGILYLVADEDHAAPWQTGPEMQVLHNEGHPDGRIDQHRAGDLYDLVAAKPETVRGPGEWNHVLIRIQDDQIEHWLNGAKVVDIQRGSAEWKAALAASKFADMPDFGKSDEGYIVLQDHGDLVWYRNMKIRRLRE
jgi:cytochrome c